MLLKYDTSKFLKISFFSSFSNFIGTPTTHQCFCVWTGKYKAIVFTFATSF